MKDMATAAAPSGASDGAVSAGYRRYALGLLMVIMTLNFVDRHVMNILAERIKEDMHLSDGQLGVITGLGFAILYSISGLPIARLAERYNRAHILSGCLAIWSGFTALGGFATSYAVLALSRVGVGVGEAGCNPSAQSLIVDYVPRAKRASALAFYYIGQPLGVLIGLSLGGLIADMYGWRAALIVVGAPGLLVAFLAVTTLREPRRDPNFIAAAAEDHPTFAETLRELRGKPTFWFAALGSALITFVAVGQSAFKASFFFRNHGPELDALAAGFGLQTAGFLGLTLGFSTGIAGILGVVLGGMIGDRFAAKDPRGYVLLPAVASLLVAPLHAWAMLTPSAVASLAILSLPALLHAMYFGPIYAMAMGIVRPRSRATTAAIYGMFISLIGIGFGPFSMGLFSDFLNNGVGLGPAEGVRWTQISSNLVIFIAVGFYLLAARTVRKDMVS